jgi:hypothetical protein
MRVMPAYDPKQTWFAATIRNLWKRQNPLLAPLQPWKGTDFGVLMSTDGWGVYDIDPSRKNITSSAIFIFETGEIWSVNTYAIAANDGIPFFHTVMTTALMDYGAFIMKNFNITPPFKVLISVDRVKGQRLLMADSRGLFLPTGGICQLPSIQQETEFTPGDSAYRALWPFFQKLVGRCGLDPETYLKGYPDKPM